MKLPALLLLLSILLSFATGYLALELRPNESSKFLFSTSEIRRLEREFQDQHPMQRELATAELFAPQAALELTDPRNVLGAARSRSFSQIASVHRAMKNCRPQDIPGRDSAKMRTWITAQCEHRPLLTGFFDQAPFLSPLGSSFAWLASESQDDNWIRDHFQYFHILELARLPQAVFAGDTRRGILRGISVDALMAMSVGQSWVIDSTHVFARRSVDSTFPSSRQALAPDYLVYARAEWENHLRNAGIESSVSSSGVSCRHVEDGICWNYSTLNEPKIKWSVAALLAFAICITLGCMVALLRSIRANKRKEERKRFALESLTHELRTPLSSLVVATEHLMTQFDSLPNTLKDTFLRITDDVQRLTRVAESSRHYLTAANTKGMLNLNRVPVASLNEFVVSTLERFADDIQINALSNDRSFEIDPYWVGVCLQNLVANAKQHGRQPIVVDIRQEKNALLFSVTDAGILGRAKRSHGLGLGLSIVATVAKAMNGRLRVTSGPTSFEMQIEVLR